ncbi:hypothetical protein WDW89_25155 [Deltaproteobacteria bacterium TL4]
MFLEVKNIPGLSVVGKAPIGMEHGGFYLNLSHMLFVKIEKNTINFYTNELVFHLYFEKEAMAEYERLKKIILKKELLLT